MRHYFLFCYFLILIQLLHRLLMHVPSIEHFQPQNPTFKFKITPCMQIYKPLRQLSEGQHQSIKVNWNLFPLNWAVWIRVNVGWMWLNFLEIGRTHSQLKIHAVIIFPPGISVSSIKSCMYLVKWENLNFFNKGEQNGKSRVDTSKHTNKRRAPEMKC